MKKVAACITAVALAATLHAQEESEYKMELGAFAGMVTYVGDYNSHLLKGMRPWGGLTARFRLNPRMALGLNLGTGQIKGSTDNVGTWYPAEHYTFNHRLTEAALRFEYNFWAYGTGREYRGARRLTPFVAAGLGLAHHSGLNNGLTMSLPIGAGIRYKIGQRLNLTAEWMMRLTPSDHLDGQSDAYGIKSSGPFKNSDCYSAFQLGLAYDLWTKCKTCNNDRD